MSSRALAIDLGLLACLSVAVCFFARDPSVMDVVVALAIALRFVLWSKLRPDERDLGLGAELAFFTLCMLLGGLNDWNTVVRQRVYDYTVPSELPEVSSVPLWMLALWGVIVRSLSSLPRWQRIGLEPLPEAKLGARLVVIGSLVLATRLSIFRFYEHPWLSWLPFAAALSVGIVLLKPGSRRVGLALVTAAFGVAIESLYINVAGLHAYRLGWLGGVPLWIALWWALAALLWGEVSARLVRAFAGIVTWLESRRCLRTE